MTQETDGRLDGGRLADVGFFADLSDEERDAVAETMRVVQVPVGNVLAIEGDLSSKFFAILDGAMTVHRKGRHVADVGPGDVVGEAGVLSLIPRNATVIATLPSEIAVLMGWDLRALVEQYPALRERAEAIMAERTGDS